MRRETGSPKILVSGNWVFQSSVSWCWPKGTWALGTRLIHNVQLGLSQVPLGLLMIWTEQKLEQRQFLFCCSNFCYVEFAMFQIPFCMCNFNSVFLNSIPFVQFLFCCFQQRIYKRHRFYITEFETRFWRWWPLIPLHDRSTHTRLVHPCSLGASISTSYFRCKLNIGRS